MPVFVLFNSGELSPYGEKQGFWHSLYPFMKGEK
jgi:hypothetical protein